jgi:hypothetical protein
MQDSPARCTALQRSSSADSSRCLASGIPRHGRCWSGSSGVSSSSSPSLLQPRARAFGPSESAWFGAASAAAASCTLHCLRHWIPGHDCSSFARQSSWLEITRRKRGERCKVLSAALVLDSLLVLVLVLARVLPALVLLPLQLPLPLPLVLVLALTLVLVLVLVRCMMTLQRYDAHFLCLF